MVEVAGLEGITGVPKEGMLNVIPVTAYRKEEWITATGSVTGERVLIQETIMPGTAMAEGMTRLQTRETIITDGEIIAAGMMTLLLQQARQAIGGMLIETTALKEDKRMQRRKITPEKMETIHAGVA
jgi:precorrin isomerase